MKKILIFSILSTIFTITSAQEVMKKNSDGTYTVNTTTLSKGVDGYAGPTPVEIQFKGDVIMKVVPLKNNETPRFFELVEQNLLPKFKKMTVKNYSSEKVDAVTGATFSSNAIKENVRLGVDYYKKHRKK